MFGSLNDGSQTTMKETEMSTQIKDTPRNTSLSDIAAQAYQLWEEAGRPADRDLEFWLLAEKQIRLGRQSPIVAFATEKSSHVEISTSSPGSRSNLQPNSLSRSRKSEPVKPKTKRSPGSP
jgi:hypothetical protein